MTDRYAAVPVKQLERWVDHALAIDIPSNDLGSLGLRQEFTKELSAAIESAVEPSDPVDFTIANIDVIPSQQHQRRRVNDE